MYLLTLILLALLIYLLIIFIITFATRSSVLDAKTKVNDFIKEVFLTETPPPQQSYGISIGIDDLGNAHADIVEKEFDGLKKIFSDFSFVGYECIGNNIAYSFEVGEPLLELSDEEMYSLCLKRCTMMVHHIIHKYNPYAGYTPDLVSVKIVGNTVIIYIAENDTGRMENAIFARRMQNVLREPKMPQTTPLEESWSD